jgi:hypothetical protein
MIRPAFLTPTWPADGGKSQNTSDILGSQFSISALTLVNVCQPSIVQLIKLCLPKYGTPAYFLPRSKERFAKRSRTTQTMGKLLEILNADQSSSCLAQSDLIAMQSGNSGFMRLQIVRRIEKLSGPHH